MDAVPHDPGSTVQGLPGQDEEDVPAATASTRPAAGASSLPAEALAALPGLTGRWRHRWEICYADGKFNGQRRDHDHETGACTYLDVFVDDPDPVAFDAKIVAWEAEHAG